VDAWQPGAFAMQAFAPVEMAVEERSAGAPRPAGGEQEPLPIVALRRFRFPVPARVQVAGGKPERVITDRRGLSGGRVETCAGPWRTSGRWWDDGMWDRDEWDVALHDGATYRVFRERRADRWFVEGIVD
jgi:protein ImuB